MLWFFIVLIIATLALDKLSMEYGYNKLFYKRKISKDRVEIGEKFSISTIIENKKAIPVTFLKVEERLPSTFDYESKANLIKTETNLYHSFSTHIMPYERYIRKCKAVSNKRGSYILGDVNLSLGDFMGIKSNSRQFSYPEEIVVLPEKLDIEDILVLYGKYHGDISIRRWIIDDPSMPIGIREYTGNEPEKYIHWPSSLRSGSLMVKDFDYTTDRSVGIILNIECSKPFWKDIKEKEIETCISLCRGVIELLEEENTPYNFLVNSYIANFHDSNNFVYPGLGINHYNFILEALGRLSYGVSNTFENFLEDISFKNYNFTSYIIITPRLFKSYLGEINKLKERGNKLMLISLDKMYLDKLDDEILTYVGDYE